MMYQKDFILRMIEMLADLIAGIIGLIKKGDYQKASESLDNAYFEYLKQDASFFRNIPIEKLTEDLLSKHNYTNGHLEILAELFFAEAELCFAQKKRNESKEFYEKTNVLLRFVIKESKIFSLEKENKLAQIKKKLAQINEWQ